MKLIILGHKRFQGLKKLDMFFWIFKNLDKSFWTKIMFELVVLNLLF